MSTSLSLLLVVLGPAPLPVKADIEALASGKICLDAGASKLAGKKFGDKCTLEVKDKEAGCGGQPALVGELCPLERGKVVLAEQSKPSGATIEVELAPPSEGDPIEWSEEKPLPAGGKLYKWTGGRATEEKDAPTRTKLAAAGDLYYYKVGGKVSPVRAAEVAPPPPPEMPPLRFKVSDPAAIVDQKICLDERATPLVDKTFGEGCSLTVKAGTAARCDGQPVLEGKLCRFDRTRIAALKSPASDVPYIHVEFVEPAAIKYLSWDDVAKLGLGSTLYRLSAGEMKEADPAKLTRAEAERGGNVFYLKRNGELSRARIGAAARLHEVGDKAAKVREKEQEALLSWAEEKCDPRAEGGKITLAIRRKQCERRYRKAAELVQAPTSPPPEVSDDSPPASESAAIASTCLLNVNMAAVKEGPGEGRERRRAGRADARLREETMCLKVDPKGAFSVLHLPEYPLPGKSLRVVVIAPDTAELKITQEGTVALQDPVLDDRTAASATEVKKDAARGEETRTMVTRVTRFAGRAPGYAPVVVKDKSNQEIGRGELMLPKTYMGSVRVGLALVFGRAVERQYEAIKAPGSPTYEITQKDCGLAGCDRVAVELVLAYSAYLEAMIGGRNYQRRVFTRHNWGFGPLLGAGIVGQSVDKVDFFKSFYMGIEFEPVRFFSIAGGAVLRRVKVLGDDYHVGSAVAEKDLLYREGHAWGAFLMFNFAPAFLKTAQPKGGG